jgi:exopolyphosphatase/guanosine-5'-triphosphate,3'-diphosphate pyrophosphatase
MTRVGAIDIGTNSVRLLVAEGNGGGGFTTLDRRMRITRLGQGVDATRALNPAAIERTLAVLREYRAALDEFEVTTARATATSAARDATNRDAFFEPATAVLGFSPEVISGDEEAALSFRGATFDIGDAPGPYLVFDIGGGSTEFVVGTTAPEGLISVNMGCVRVTEQFLTSDPPSAEELSNAIYWVKEHLSDVQREIPQLFDARTAVGLAGTVSSAAMVEQGLLEYDRDRVHHFRLTRPAIEDVFRTLATEPTALRATNPGLEPGRVDVIVGGLVVLASIVRMFAIDEVLVSESDILDGIALSLLPA